MLRTQKLYFLKFQLTTFRLSEIDCILTKLSQIIHIHVNCIIIIPYPVALEDMTKTTDSQYIPGGADLFYRYIGDKHGIQGYRNSCYVDATIFGLFALSDSFDSLILAEPTSRYGNEIKQLLLNGVINPLRRYIIYYVHVCICTCINNIIIQSLPIAVCAMS